MSDAPRIGLALGSGGARGFAHIPVLEAFDALQVRPAVVAGTSIGAVIGAAWCAGHSGAALRRLVLETIGSPMALAADAAMSGASGLGQVFSQGFGAFQLDGEKLLARIWPRFMPATFEELDTPFVAVATDLATGERHAMTSGPLASAVAASMAIPGLFRPVNRDGRVLIDGVAADPLPMASLAGRCDLAVAVEINGVAASAGEAPAEHDPLGVALRGISLIEHALTRTRLALHPPDLLLQPPVAAVKPLDVLKAATAIAAGEASGRAVADWLSTRIRARPRG
jgi:NTE family protein